jgi:hypothetical protein
MRFPTCRRPGWCLKALLLGGLLLVPMGGCPIDTDQVTTDVFQATLQSVTSSLVDALSAYLAGN